MAWAWAKNWEHWQVEGLKQKKTTWGLLMKSARVGWCSPELKAVSSQFLTHSHMVPRSQTISDGLEPKAFRSNKSVDLSWHTAGVLYTTKFNMDLKMAPTFLWIKSCPCFLILLFLFGLKEHSKEYVGGKKAMLSCRFSKELIYQLHCKKYPI